MEGYKTAEWILLDYGDFVVHVFEQKARQFSTSDVSGAGRKESGWRGNLPATVVVL